jgi:hypothetical protein
MPINHHADGTAVPAELAEIFRSVLRDPDIELTLQTTSDD